MNIKYTLFLVATILLNLSLVAQDYSGTWVGVLNDDMSSPRRISRFALQLQQRGRAVWGVYTTGENLTIKHAQCACTINAQLGKKDRTSVDLYKDGLISSQIAETACDFVTNLEAKYLKKDDKEYLAGKWFGNVPSSRRSDGASGDFTVVKISDTINVDINSYFPKLERLIEKANPGDTAFRSKSKAFQDNRRGKAGNVAQVFPNITYPHFSDINCDSQNESSASAFILTRFQNYKFGVSNKIEVNT